MPLKKIKMLFKMTDREIHAEFAFATFGFGSCFIIGTIPIFSHVRFSYLAPVQDKKITCVLPANA
jgi:hypothetical protein